MPRLQHAITTRQPIVLPAAPPYCHLYCHFHANKVDNSTDNKYAIPRITTPKTPSRDNRLTTIDSQRRQ